jgi:dehydrogenase/reductase SDR family member 1
VATAIVTGASRGIGRATAISLGERGYRVYVTGRTRTAGVLPGTIGRTAEEVTAAGGTGVAVACDHADADAVTALFVEVADEVGSLDVLVNNVFPTDVVESAGDVPFFDQPLETIDAMLGVGVRTHYAATWHAVPLLRRAGGGLVVNITSAGAAYTVLSPSYTMAKAALDKFTVDAAKPLSALGVTIVSVWPGPMVATEAVLANPSRQMWDITETPFLTGRAIAHLAADPDVGRLSGRVLVSADIAKAYGFADLDDASPAFPFDEPQVRRQLLKRAPYRLARDEPAGGGQ